MDKKNNAVQMEPHKSFVVDILTAIQGCHGQNVAFSRKVIDQAKSRFLAKCRYDFFHHSLLDETVGGISDLLSEIRFIDPQEEARVVQLKRQCLEDARKVLAIAAKIPLLDSVAPTAPFSFPERAEEDELRQSA